MPVLTGYPVSAFDIVSGSSNLNVGDTFRVDPAFDADTDFLTYTISDADSSFEGDASNNEVGDDSSQSAVVTNASGGTVASGQIYIEGARTLTAPDGSTVTLYQLEIAGSPVGWIAQPELQPGVTYQIDTSFNITSSNAPLYSSFTDDVDYDPDDANDILGGNLADDIQAGAQDDTVNAGAGDDTVDGGSGDDSLVGGGGNDSLTGGTGSDTLVGQDGDDTMHGGDGADSLYGHADDDLLYGDDGDDLVSGDEGTDTLYGGDGDDTIVGGADDDLMFGDAGDDVFVWHSTYSWGSDTITGGETGESGGDTIDLSQVTSSVTVTYAGDEAGTITDGTGTITFSQIENLILTDLADVVDASADSVGVTIDAGDGADTITGGSGDDSLSGGSGNDNFFGSAGADTLDGEGWFDYVDYSTSSQAVHVDLSDAFTEIGGDAQGDVLISIEQVHGSNFNDTLVAASGGSNLVGEAGNDSIVGGAGDDDFWGGSGDDTLSGGAGDDYLDGDSDSDTFTIADGFGSDTIVGGESGTDFDTIDLSALSSAVTVTYTGDGAGTITDGTDTLTFSEIENLILTDFADVVDGTADTAGLNIDAGDGDNTVTGGSGDDSIAGGDGSDLFEGGDGSDTLQGWDGDDTLVGGAGGDSLQGGAGLDFADYSASDAAVTIDLSTGSAGGGHATGDTLAGIDGITGSDFDDNLTGFDGSGPDYTNIIDGGAGNDTIDGKGSDDILIGGSGDDSILGGTGDDTISAGSGSDVVLGGDGNDVITGDNSAENLITNGDFSAGGTGWTVNNPTGGAAPHFFDGDVASFNNSDETVYGDSIEQDFDAPVGVSHTLSLDLLENNGGTGDHTFQIEILDDTGAVVATQTHTVTDGTTLPVSFTFTPTTGTSTLRITNTTATNSIGTDGKVDNVSIVATDTVQGDDTLSGGLGDDTLTGGGGNDVFTYAVGDGHDTITDFNTGNTGTLDDGDSANNDFVDLSGFYDNLSELYADQADDGILNQSNATDSKGRSVNYADNDNFGSGSLTFTGASGDNSSFTQENTGVVCFASTTQILTPRGYVPVHQLRVGDLVATMDNGPSKIRWIGRRQYGHAELTANPGFRPIRIKSGILGARRDVLLSPLHAVLADADHFVRVKHLAELQNCRISRAEGRREVTYYHLLLDRHEVIFADGVACESFFPGPQGLALYLRDGTGRGLFDLLPELRDVLQMKRRVDDVFGRPARPFIRRGAVLREGCLDARGNFLSRNGGWQKATLIGTGDPVVDRLIPDTKSVPGRNHPLAKPVD